MKTIEQTCLLSIRRGDILMYDDGRIGQLVDIQLVPNGIDDTTIVAILTIKLENGNKLQATSNNFKPVPREPYLEKMYN